MLDRRALIFGAIAGAGIGASEWVRQREAAAADLIRPDSTLTPGAIVTTDAAVVCVSGYAGTQRPSKDESAHLKTLAFQRYGIPESRRSEFQMDHLISLELGGDPRAPENIWPQPWVGVWNAHMKDFLEDWLHHEVCAGRMALVQAQTELRTDWIASYQTHIGG